MGRHSTKQKLYHCCGLSWTAPSGLHYHKVHYHGYKPKSKRGRKKGVVRIAKDLLKTVDNYLDTVALQDDIDYLLKDDLFESVEQKALVNDDVDLLADIYESEPGFDTNIFFN